MPTRVRLEYVNMKSEMKKIVSILSLIAVCLLLFSTSNICLPFLTEFVINTNTSRDCIVI